MCIGIVITGRIDIPCYSESLRNLHYFLLTYGAALRPMTMGGHLSPD